MLKRTSESKNENSEGLRTSLFQGPWRFWHFSTSIIIVWTAKTHQMLVLEMLSILMFNLVTPSYLLCVSSQWTIAVHLKTVNVKTLLIEALHIKGYICMILECFMNIVTRRSTLASERKHLGFVLTNSDKVRVLILYAMKILILCSKPWSLSTSF